MACLSCETGTDQLDRLDHCHGTLIVHTDNTVECTDDDCYSTDQARHTFIVDCFDVAGGCGCTETATIRRAG